jgi:hypothetical protein
MHFVYFLLMWDQDPKDTLNTLADGDYPNLARLFLEVDVLDIFDGEAEESLSEAAELFGGIGSEEL